MNAVYFLVNVIFHLLSILIVLFISSVAKHLESANTMFSFVWWIIGFYWVSAGGQALAQDSPQLYWFVLFQFLIQIVHISFHFIIYSSFGKSTGIFLF